MALTPTDKAHGNQIQAGTLGRRLGHNFEEQIAEECSRVQVPYQVTATPGQKHLFEGNPAQIVLEYICAREGLHTLRSVRGFATGSLATSEEGRQLLAVEGKQVAQCKSDIVLSLEGDGKRVTVGISTKQSNNLKPTNAQLYFTTATAFVNLLRGNGLLVSLKAELALKQFCGEAGLRPMDQPHLHTDRRTDTRRLFWEEVDETGRGELTILFDMHQEKIFSLLLQKAYKEDPFVPAYVVHKTRRAEKWDSTQIAIYSIIELTALSKHYGGFSTREYTIRKGTYKDPQGVQHLAPRFGIIQMQRGGQAQHPTQLQFNLEAGYFYKLPQQIE